MAESNAYDLLPPNFGKGFGDMDSMLLFPKIISHIQTQYIKNHILKNSFHPRFFWANSARHLHMTKLRTKYLYNTTGLC